MSEYTEVYDYVVVGSGAGGGVLAARLAEAGHCVIVLEAGCEGVDASQRLPGEATPTRNLADDYAVPAFHPFASEHADISWDFWVHHYKNRADRARDPKYREAHDGVLYPRCSTVGGCTAHNAMIVVRPHAADWNHIWQITGDASWRASNMEKYFQRMERCEHRNAVFRWLAKLDWNPTGHGWRGWLPTRKVLPLRTLLDWRLRRTLLRSVERVISLLPDGLQLWRHFVQAGGDPNDARLVHDHAHGVRYLPVSIDRKGRVGARELLHQVKAAHPARLTIRENALVTRVEIDSASRRATGVVYRLGRKLYRAPGADGAPWQERRVGARKEVILAAGAFNTPQLLMLSGIGAAQALAEFKIPVLQDLPGVGRNLQDRYEVGIVNQMKAPWPTLCGAAFDSSDRHYRRFRRYGGGLYASNGAMLSVVLRSKEDRVHPDLFCLSFLTDFRGYEPGYSQRLLRTDCLSWVVLKAHTNNTAGVVTLQSSDPLVPPHVQFNYFQDGNDASGDDLDAVVAGVKLVRQIADATPELALEEEYPGRHIYTDAQLKDFVRSAAWGHHACGTCAMKPRAEDGVVDSEFRVYGIDGLRIVDASVLPRIPGFFIVACIYMIAEKAADVILQGARVAAAPAGRTRSCNSATQVQQSRSREAAFQGVAARDREASPAAPATQQ